MADKIINTRVQNKYDTLENWNSSELVLKSGEIAIVEIPREDSTQGMTPPAIAIKVGDGENTFSDLSYIQAIAGDVQSWAKAANLKDAVLTGYTKLTDSGAIAATDTLNKALSKLENAIKAASHDHSNKTVLDKIEEALTTELKTNYDSAYTHSTSPHAPAGAQVNVIEKITVNKQNTTVTSKTVDITVPTKLSDLTDGKDLDKTFCDVTYENNTLSFRHEESGEVLKTVDLPKEQFLDTASTKFVNKFKWDAVTYPESTNPTLDNKPVLVLALKDEDEKVSYSFIDMTELVDVYTGGSTATASVTVGSDNKITANVTSVSTDLLTQGTQTLIFNCGNASA